MNTSAEKNSDIYNRLNFGLESEINNSSDLQAADLPHARSSQANSKATQLTQDAAEGPEQSEYQHPQEFSQQEIGLARSEIALTLMSKDNVSILRTLRSEWLSMLLVLLACIAVNMLSFSFPNTLLAIPVAKIAGINLGIIVPVLGIIPFFLLVSIVRRVYDERYIIGPKSVIRISGLASFTTAKREIYHGNIRAVEIEQGVIQRMLKVGNLKIGDLFSSSSDIVMRGIRNPEQVQAILERRLRV